MNYKIIVDSCCDYTDYADGLNWLQRVPLTISLGEKQYVDNEKLNCLDLIRDIKASNEGPKSACPSLGNFMEAYETEAEDIYVVTISEKLSGTYGSAFAAANLYKENNKKNIHIFNTKSAAPGEVVTCLKIRELAESGLQFDEIVAKTEEFIDSMRTYGVLESLEVLRKNGRLTRLESAITGTLKIKLVINATPEGEIESVNKALSINSALRKMVDQVKKRCEEIDPRERILVITQCNCPQRAELVKKMIGEACAFKDIVICRASGISTIYGNDGGIIIAF